VAETQMATWNARYWEWLQYLVEVVQVVDSGSAIALGPSFQPLVPPAFPNPARAVKAVYCAPHPDDEALSAALALRWRLQGAQVTNVAITLGSDLSQRTRRLSELKSACRVLGFNLVVPATDAGPSGFEGVNLKSRQDHPREWGEKVRILSEIFESEQPDVVFAPHAEDFNTTHIGTHYLVVEALARHLERAGGASLPLIQTEFWHQLFQPNLMVGLTAEVVAHQLTAATEHGGEMSRNPYHLRHACRLMDNVRRGSEVVGGQGAPAQPFTFAELYQIAFVQQGKVVTPGAHRRIIGPKDAIDLEALVSEFRTAAA
jgi:N-acetylglucosamine malate deacetylase 1